MLRFALLHVAGHETTANMISLSTVAFLRNPEQHAMIKADPGKTLNAVEEMLWYFTIIDVATARLCVEDIKVGGQRAADPRRRRSAGAGLFGQPGPAGVREPGRV